MAHSFHEMVFEEYKAPGRNRTIIKSENASVSGKIKFSVEADDQKGVKIIIKRDADDTIKELKFLCKCGETKSIILDYDSDPADAGDK